MRMYCTEHFDLADQLMCNKVCVASVSSKSSENKHLAMYCLKYRLLQTHFSCIEPMYKRNIALAITRLILLAREILLKYHFRVLSEMMQLQ